MERGIGPGIHGGGAELLSQERRLGLAWDDYEPQRNTKKTVDCKCIKRPQSERNRVEGSDPSARSHSPGPGCRGVRVRVRGRVRGRRQSPRSPPHPCPPGLSLGVRGQRVQGWCLTPCPGRKSAACSRTRG
eukprot:3560090-Rhodomonas_salina.1